MQLDYMNLLVINGSLHNKNKEGLEKMLQFLKITYKFGSMVDIKNFDIIYSPSIPINSALYPKKKLYLDHIFQYSLTKDFQ